MTNNFRQDFVSYYADGDGAIFSGFLAGTDNEPIAQLLRENLSFYNRIGAEKSENPSLLAGKYRVELEITFLSSSQKIISADTPPAPNADINVVFTSLTFDATGNPFYHLPSQDSRQYPLVPALNLWGGQT